MSSIRSTKPTVASSSNGWPIEVCARGARRLNFFAGQLVPPAEYTRVTGNYAPVDSGDSPSAGQTNILSYRILYQDAAGLGGEVSWDGNSGPAEVSRDLGRFERCSHRLRKVNSVKRQDEHLLWTDIGPPCLFVW